MSGYLRDFLIRWLADGVVGKFGWFLSFKRAYGFDRLFGVEGSKGYYGSDLWRFWISQSLLWISCEEFPRSDCAHSMEVGICLFNFEIRYQHKETTVVSPLRKLSCFWFLKGFTVLLVSLRSNLGESDYISSIFEGNQFGYGWFNGLIGLDLQIFRLGVSFLGILKESYCKIEGDIRVLSRSQRSKQNRTNRGLREDSRLLMIPIMVGIPMRSILEIVDIGCLRDLWKLFQPWFPFVSLIRCVFFGGNHLLLLSGFLFVPPIYFLGCNGVLVFYLNNSMVSSDFFEFSWLYVGEIVKQGNFVSLMIVSRLIGSHYWVWVMMLTDWEYVIRAIFGFWYLWCVISRVSLQYGLKVITFLLFWHLLENKWRFSGLTYEIKSQRLSSIWMYLNLHFGITFGDTVNHISCNDDLVPRINFIFNGLSVSGHLWFFDYEVLVYEKMILVICTHRHPSSKFWVRFVTERKLIISRKSSFYFFERDNASPCVSVETKGKVIIRISKWVIIRQGLGSDGPQYPFIWIYISSINRQFSGYKGNNNDGQVSKMEMDQGIFLFFFKILRLEKADLGGQQPLLSKSFL